MKAGGSDAKHCWLQLGRWPPKYFQLKEDLYDKYGVEGYWRLLLLQNLWVTPGVQVIFDSTFNPQEDTVTHRLDQD